MKLFLQYLCFVLVFAEMVISAKPQSELIDSQSHPMHQQVNENNIPRSNIDDSKIDVDSEDGAEEDSNQIDGAAMAKTGTEENADNTETSADYKENDSVESERETENNTKGDDEETSGTNPISSVPEFPTIDLKEENSPIKTNEKKPLYFDKTFYKNLVDSFILAGLPYVSTLKGITDVITAWTTKKPEKSIWDQIKDKVAHQQRETITKYHTRSLKSDRVFLTQKLQKGHHLTFSDMGSIVSRKFLFFPNQFPTNIVAFTGEWVSSVIFYIMNLAGAYMEMMRPERPDNLKIKACDWFEELGNLREDIIRASKQLHKLRYQHTIKGVISGYLRDSMKTVEKEGIPDKWFTTKTEGYTQQGVLTFEDKIAKKNYTYWLPHVRSKFLDGKLLNDMKRYVEPMLTYFNDLLGNSSQVNLENCTCPEKLEEKDVSFTYPTKNYGNTTEMKYACSVPCLVPHNSKPICSFKDATRWATGTKIAQVFYPSSNKNWDYCTPATQKTWDWFMWVDEPLPSQYENVNYYYGKKKKEKKNKSAATKQNED